MLFLSWCVAAGTAPGQFQQPCGLTVLSTYDPSAPGEPVSCLLYVVDQKSKRVQAFDAVSGVFMRVVGEAAAGATGATGLRSTVSGATGATVASAGTIELRHSVGGATGGTGTGLRQPVGVAAWLRSCGRVYPGVRDRPGE